MPPRSATRRKSTSASARVRKLASKSNQLDVESSVGDQNNTAFELGSEGQAFAAVGTAGGQLDGDSSEAVQLVISGKEINQEVGILDSNVYEVEEGLPTGGEEKVVGSTPVEVRFAEEALEEERNVEGVMGDQVNVEINQEVGILESNSSEVGEGLLTGGEEKVVVSTPVEVRFAEEALEVERNVERVMGEHVNVNAKSLTRGGGVAEESGTRMEAVQIEGGQEKNDDACMAEATDKCDNAAEEKVVENAQIEGRGVGSVSTQLDVVPVTEQNSCEGAVAAQINDAEVLGDDEDFVAIGDNNDGEEGDAGGGKDAEDIGDSEEDNEDEENPSVFINNHTTDGKKEKDLEIYIGRLDKGATEDDLIKVFGKFGEIKTARVVRHPTTNKSRGFAFIRYATVEQANNALSALKDGIEVRSKHVNISASQDNDTLYMGNICKLWTKELVLGTLKSYGIENIEEIHLPDDAQKEGTIKGFAFLKFSSHLDARAAFQRLRKPDAVFGRDISAKVAFAQTPIHPHEAVLSQVKTVYVEGLTDAWNEERVKEICKQYGEVVKVKLSRSLGIKRKDFGFVTFTSRESALACIEGINNAHIGGGEFKVKASIAKPHFSGRLRKKGPRGGFKVNGAVPSTKEEIEREDGATSSKMKGHGKSKRAKKKGTVAAEEKGKAPSEPEISRGKPNKLPTVTEGQSVQAPSKLDRKNRKRKNLNLKADGRGKIGAEHGHNEKPSKKAKGNGRAKQSNNFKKPKRDHRKGPNYGADFMRYRNPYAPRYAASAGSNLGHAYNTISGSKRPYADMEPHAGYIEPVARKHGRSYSGNPEPPVGRQYQPHARHLESAAGMQSQPQTGYHEHAVGKHGRPHAGYLEPAVGTHGQPHAGYLEPAVGRQGQPQAGYFESAIGKHSDNPYEPASRRAGRQDLHGSGHPVYAQGYSLALSYVSNNTGYAGYEDGRSIRGHYQSSGAHLTRRAYN